eukprot:7226392-Lingulodinium_polyedra.AAC.1
MLLQERCRSPGRVGIHITQEAPALLVELQHLHVFHNECLACDLVEQLPLATAALDQHEAAGVRHSSHCWNCCS